jgi:WD40 repeat protein
MVGADSTSPSRTERFRFPAPPPFGAVEGYRIGLWNMESDEGVRWFEGHNSNVERLALSQDGGRLASASHDGTVITWDVGRGKELCRWPARGRERPTALALSPDGKVVAVGLGRPDGGGGRARLLEASSGRALGDLEGAYPCSLAFSPCGTLLAVGTDHQGVRLGDVARRRFVRELHGHARAVTTLCFSPDGKYLATAGLDGTARLWNVALGRERRRLGEGRSRFIRFAFSADGRTLAWGEDETIRLCETLTGRERLGFDGRRAGPPVAFAAGGKALVTGEGGDALRFWSTRTWAAGRAVRGPGWGAFTFAGDRRSLIALVGGRIRLWDLGTGAKLREFEARPRLRTAVLSSKGRWLAAEVDGRVRVWETATGERLHPLEGWRGGWGPLAFSPDGKVLFGSGRDGDVVRWEVATGKQQWPRWEERLADPLVFFPDHAGFWGRLEVRRQPASEADTKRL